MPSANKFNTVPLQYISITRVFGTWLVRSILDNFALYRETCIIAESMLMEKRRSNQSHGTFIEGAVGQDLGHVASISMRLLHGAGAQRAKTFRSARYRNATHHRLYLVEVEDTAIALQVLAVGGNITYYLVGILPTRDQSP